jgi:hypothetical protein
MPSMCKLKIHAWNERVQTSEISTPTNVKYNDEVEEKSYKSKYNIYLEFFEVDDTISIYISLIP